MSEQSFQVGVKALIKNPEGEVLSIYDTAHEWWDIPGGRIDDDEEIADCLDRELREEIGVGALSSHLLHSTISKVRLQKAVGHRLLLLVYATELDGTPVANEPNTELIWLSPEELSTKITNKYTDDFCSWLATQ